MDRLPTRLTIANNGNQPLAAGTVISVSARRVRPNGLLEADTRVLVTRAGQDSNGRGAALASAGIEGDVSTLQLVQELPAGQSITAVLTWQGIRGVAKSTIGTVQVIASSVLDDRITSYTQALSAEVIFRRI